MSSAQHLILPYAHAPGWAVGPGTAAGELPTLRRLMTRLQPGPLLAGDAQDLSPPHERALAQALGLPVADGAIPWAAWERGQSGQAPDDEAWAWITPCHWHVARDHILMHPIDTLQLDETASRTLLAAIAPYFQEDGIALDFIAPPAGWRGARCFAIWPAPAWTVWWAAMSTTGCRAPLARAPCAACNKRCRCCCTPTR